MQGMQEIAEISDDYLNQSHVLKHLAKEIRIPINRRSNTRDSALSDGISKDPPKYQPWISEEEPANTNNNGNSGGSIKLKSKSQPDLTKLVESDVEEILKQNAVLKQQLNACYTKVSRTQKVS